MCDSINHLFSLLTINLVQKLCFVYAAYEDYIKCIEQVVWINKNSLWNHEKPNLFLDSILKTKKKPI